MDTFLKKEKLTLLNGWKAVVLVTIWQVTGTPPWSKSGACIQRDNLGTREGYLSP